MAYNVRDEINKLLTNKKDWEQSDYQMKLIPKNKNLETGKVTEPTGVVYNQAKKTRDNAASSSQGIYAGLRANGYGDIADYFQNNGYSNSKSYADGYFGNGNEYNPETIAKKINALKHTYDTSDEAGKAAIAAEGQGLYAQLYRNGDEVLANNLQNRNAAEANKYLESYYKIQGKTAMRPYLYEKGKQYGLSNSDIDNALVYNEQTGEISFGGKNIGKPTSVVDGVSYWNPEQLDTIWNDYTSRTGITPTNENMLSQQWQELFNQRKNAIDTAMNENPFTNEVGKSILGKYDLSAFRAGNNAAAAGSATNGGNIDSFSAANAMRNQAALVAMGQEKALEAQKQKIEHAKGLLADMGVDIDRLFNQDETRKNNETDNYVKRKTVDTDSLVKQAGVTGYVPEEWTYSNNPYLDKNGNVINPDNINFQAKIDENNEKLKNSALDETERQRLIDDNNALIQARNIKLNLPSYSQYSGEGDRYYTPQITEDRRQAEAADSLSRYSRKLDSEDTRYVSDINAKMNEDNNKTVRYQTDKDSEDTRYVADSTERQNAANNASQEKQTNAALEAAKERATQNNQYSGKPTDHILTENEVINYANWMNSLKSDTVVDDNGQLRVNPDRKDFVLSYIMTSEYNDDQIRYLCQQLGLTEDDINNWRSKYGG